MVHNPFSSEVAARLYASGRPDYSTYAREVTRRLLGITKPVSRAVDVGCGTGISTLALVPLADSIIAIEPIPAMLNRAPQLPNVTYVLGSAEALPVESSSCDLIAVGSALHWFDKELFLREANRIAKPDAWLVIYDHWFVGQMSDNPIFGDWIQNTYLTTYPSPPRHRSWRPPADLSNWRHIAWERYDHPIEMSLSRLASYLLTQSNLQTPIENGDQSEEELKAWLATELSPFFANQQSRTLEFGGLVACHQQPR